MFEQAFLGQVLIRILGQEEVEAARKAYSDISKTGTRTEMEKAFTKYKDAYKKAKEKEWADLITKQVVECGIYGEKNVPLCEKLREALLKVIDELWAMEPHEEWEIKLRERGKEREKQGELFRKQGRYHTGEPMPPPSVPTPFRPRNIPQGAYSPTSEEQGMVPSVDCGPGRFWNGTECRGSIGRMPGLPGGFGEAMTATPGTLAPSMPATTYAISGIPLVRGLGTRVFSGI